MNKGRVLQKENKKHYMVVEGVSGKYLLHEIADMFDCKPTAVCYFQMPTLNPTGSKELFEEELLAALRASKLLGDATVYWTHDGVEVDTGMEYKGGAWAGYCEINSQMAN